MKTQATAVILALVAPLVMAEVGRAAKSHGVPLKVAEAAPGTRDATIPVRPAAGLPTIQKIPPQKSRTNPGVSPTRKAQDRKGGAAATPRVPGVVAPMAPKWSPARQPAPPGRGAVQGMQGRDAPRGGGRFGDGSAGRALPGTDNRKDRGGHRFFQRGVGASGLRLPENGDNARSRAPGGLTGRGGATMMKPEGGAGQSGRFAPAVPFVPGPDGAPRGSSDTAAPQEEGLYKDNDLTYGAGRDDAGGSEPSDPFERDADGSARSSSGGFAGGDKATGTPDPFVRNADGSPRSTPGRSSVDHPRYDEASDTYVYGDGTRVRGTDPSGGGGKVNDKGDIVYGDGTIVTHDPDSGTTTVVRPDGSTETHRSGAPRYDKATDSFVYGDGTRVRGSDPKGGRGKASPDGSIDYPDGTRVSHDTSTGRTEVHHADGSTTVHDEHGGRLETGPGMNTSRSEDGGTTVRDSRTGVTAHFGPGESSYEKGQQKKPEEGGDEDSSSGSTSGDSGGGSGDSSGDSSSGNSDDSGSEDSSDDSSDDSDSGDSGDSGSDDADSGDSGDSGSDDSGDGDSDELTAGEGGGSSATPDGIARRTDPGYRDRDRGGCSDEAESGGSAPGGGTVTQPGTDPDDARGCAGGSQPTADSGSARRRMSGVPSRAAGGSGPGGNIDPDRFGGTGAGVRAHNPLEGVDARTNPAPAP